MFAVVINSKNEKQMSPNKASVKKWGTAIWLHIMQLLKRFLRNCLKHCKRIISKKKQTWMFKWIVKCLV